MAEILRWIASLEEDKQKEIDFSTGDEDAESE